MNNNLSDNLKKIRKDNNLSQEQLAEELNVSRQAISKWESGVAYPEMEKLIQLSERFDLNIDDLLHKDIREVKGEKITKNNINKIFDSILSFITDTVNMFISMSFKSKIKCLFEQVVIGFVLFLLALFIGKLSNSLLNSFIQVLPDRLSHVIFSIFESLYAIIMVGVSICIMVHLFKTRYLDYYLKTKISDDKEDKKDNTEDVKDKEILNKKESKIVIRDPKHSEYRFFSGIYKFIILCIKIFALFILMFFCISLITLLAFFIISFLIIKSGLVFLGAMLSILSLGTINVLVVLILLNFIFSRKNNKKKMIWSFIISLITLGVGVGLIFISSISYDVSIYSDDDINFKTETYEVDMTDDTFYGYSDIEYIEKDIDNLEIEYKLNKYCDATHYYSPNGSYFYVECNKPMKILRQFIDNFNNKKIILESEEIKDIKIYTSKDNIQILKDNLNNYENKIYELDSNNCDY